MLKILKNAGTDFVLAVKDHQSARKAHVEIILTLNEQAAVKITLDAGQGRIRRCRFKATGQQSGQNEILHQFPSGGTLSYCPGSQQSLGNLRRSPDVVLNEDACLKKKGNANENHLIIAQISPDRDRNRNLN